MLELAVRRPQYDMFTKCRALLVTATILGSLLIIPAIPLYHRSHFLSPFRRGDTTESAIDILRTNHGPICRVYSGCIDKSGRLHLPEWMSVYSRVLNYCGLSPSFQNVRYRFAPKHDWLGAGSSGAELHVIADELFTVYRKISADEKTLRIDRTCISAPGGVSKICARTPASRLNPAILSGKGGVDENELLTVIREGVWSGYGANITVISPLETKRNTCFRSIISGSAKKKVLGKASPDAVLQKRPQNDKANLDIISKSVDKVISKWKHGKKKTDPTRPAKRSNPKKNDSASRRSDKQQHGPDSFEEGGVELFTHRTIAHKVWNKTIDSLPSKHTYGVCRIHRVCRMSDSTLLFPVWMKRFENELRDHCGIGKVDYIGNVIFERGMKKLTKMSGELSMDLIGNRVYRNQEQHFMTDFFHDGIHALDALYNRNNRDGLKFERKCIYRPRRGAGTITTTPQDCRGGREEHTALKPALLLQDQSKSTKTSVKYIREFLIMVPPFHTELPAVLRSFNMSGGGPADSTCFRSIVLTRNSYPPPDVLHHDEGNVIFAGNNISRADVAVKKSTEKNGMCKIRVTILDPWEESNDRKRLENAGRIPRPSFEIQNQAEVIRYAERFASVNGISLSIERFSHDGKNMTDYMERVQNSEVILSVNNPTMTSITFARANTLVIEVQPFSYSVGPYRSFASSLSLKHVSVTADPDVEAFERCVRNNYRYGWKRSVKESEKELNMENLILLFKQHSAVHDGNTSALRLNNRRHVNGTVRSAHIPMERVCARAQRLRVNATMVAKFMVSHAISLCSHDGQRQTVG